MKSIEDGNLMHRRTISGGEQLMALVDAQQPVQPVWYLACWEFDDGKYLRRGRIPARVAEVATACDKCVRLVRLLYSLADDHPVTVSRVYIGSPWEPPRMSGHGNPQHVDLNVTFGGAWSNVPEVAE